MIEKRSEPLAQSKSQSSLGEQAPKLKLFDDEGAGMISSMNNPAFLIQIPSVSSESENSYFKKIATDSEEIDKSEIDISVFADNASSHQSVIVNSRNIMKMVSEIERTEHNNQTGNRKEELMWKKH